MYLIVTLSGSHRLAKGICELWDCKTTLFFFCPHLTWTWPTAFHLLLPIPLLGVEIHPALVSHVLGVAEWEWFWDELVKDTGKSILCWSWFCSVHELCTKVFWRDLLFVKWLHQIKACWLDIYVTLLPLLSWDLCWVFCCNPLPFPKQQKTKQDKKPNPKIPQNTFQHWTPVKWQLEWWSNFSKTSSASGEVTAH